MGNKKYHHERPSKGLKKAGCRDLVDDTVYRWRVTDHACSFRSTFHLCERALLIEKRENPGQRVVTLVGGDDYKYHNECYAKYVLSLKDMCCSLIDRKNINFMTKKLPKDLQQYISRRLETKLVLLETSVPYCPQVTPKMVRAVILRALESGWDPNRRDTNQFLVSLDDCGFYLTKEEFEHKINSNPSLHPFKDYLITKIHQID